MTVRALGAAAGAAAFPFCSEIIPAISLDGSRVYCSAIQSLPHDDAGAILADEERHFGLTHREGEGFAVRAERALRQREDRDAARRLAFRRRFGG